MSHASPSDCVGAFIEGREHGVPVHERKDKGQNNVIIGVGNAEVFLQDEAIQFLGHRCEIDISVNRYENRPPLQTGLVFQFIDQVAVANMFNNRPNVANTTEKDSKDGKWVESSEFVISILVLGCFSHWSLFSVPVGAARRLNCSHCPLRKGPRHTLPR